MERRLGSPSRDAWKGLNLNKSRPFVKEIFLKQGHWQNIPEAKQQWYDYNHDARHRAEMTTIHQEIIPVIRRIIRIELTERQREVLTLSFFHGHTQEQIANELNISQPTVSQHLNGKKRNGKVIGGAIRKIRKVLRRNPSLNGLSEGSPLVLNILNLLLDKDISCRRSSELLRMLLK